MGFSRGGNNGSNNSRDTVLNELDSKALLARYGIPVVSEKKAQDADEAAAAAAETGFPVVLKALGRDILHKTERSLVYLNLNSEQEVKEAAEAISSAAGDSLEALLVQSQVRGSREFVAGLFHDPQYGPVVMFGLGGIFTEVLSDVSFRLAPVSDEEAAEMTAEIRSAALLDSFRGQGPVDRNTLIRTLTGLSRISSEEPDIKEIDINPLLITPEGTPVAVDALVIRGEKVSGEKPLTRPVDPADVGRMFYPKSVAFIGASARPRKWGFNLLANTISGGYSGEIYPVNPKGGIIFGREAYKSVEDIPDPVDAAVVSIPAAQVRDLIPGLKQKGVRSMVLIASGFSETGTAGRKLEQKLVADARAAGINIIGPNTMGICNPHSRFYCTGMHVKPRPGSIGIVAQSGNMGVQLLAFAEIQGIGIRAFCGSGNEGMTTIEDYLDAFEEDSLTETVMLYIESVKDGRRFYESASRLCRKKPVVLLKGGRSSAGLKAASSHTGALASDNRVFDAVCRQAGIVKVEKPMDLLDLSAAFSALPLPEGNRVAVMTLGGGWGVVAADLCEAYGLEVPELDPAIIRSVDELLPEYWSRANPIDLVGEADPSIPMTVMEALMKWDGCDAVLNLGIMGRRHMITRLADSVRTADPSFTEDFLEKAVKPFRDFENKYIEHIVSLMEKYKKPVLGVSMLKGENDRTVYNVESLTYKGLFFPTPEQAVKSLSKMCEYKRFLLRTREKS